MNTDKMNQLGSIKQAVEQAISKGANSNTPSVKEYALALSQGYNTTAQSGGLNNPKELNKVLEKVQVLIQLGEMQEPSEAWGDTKQLTQTTIDDYVKYDNDEAYQASISEQLQESHSSAETGGSNDERVVNEATGKVYHRTPNGQLIPDEYYEAYVQQTAEAHFLVADGQNVEPNLYDNLTDK